MFNKLSWHDDIAYGSLLSFSGAIGLGRWLRAVLAYAVAVITNGANRSLPLFHGLVSIFFIALSAFILIRIFCIENELLQIILCGLLVTYPVVTSTFGYMFTAPYYFFALFLAVFSVYYESLRNNTVSFLVSSICICCSLGIYQAYFSVSVSCFVLLLIVSIIDERLDTVETIFYKGMRYLYICICGLAEYYIIWKLFLRLVNVSTSSYQGLNSIGATGIYDYIKGIGKAIFIFFLLYEKNGCDLFPMRGVTVLEGAVIILSAGISLMFIIQKMRKDIFKGLMLACLIGLLPLCFNLICLMCATTPDSRVHTLMLYADSMLYVYCIWLLQYMIRNKTRSVRTVYRVFSVTLCLLLLVNVYFANACYLKAELIQEQTLSEMTVLVTRIKSVEQYKDELPVAFVMTGNIDSTRTDNQAFDDFAIVPFDKYIDPYSMERNMVNFLSNWCGFSPQYADAGHFVKMKEVEEMPSYPDDGSIRIIENTVVVKL